jgi:hypothetical protein
MAKLGQCHAPDATLQHHQGLIDSATHWQLLGMAMEKR